MFHARTYGCLVHIKFCLLLKSDDGAQIHMGCFVLGAAGTQEAPLGRQRTKNNKQVGPVVVRFPLGTFSALQHAVKKLAEIVPTGLVPPPGQRPPIR